MTKPLNQFEPIMMERSVKRTAEKMLAEAKGKEQRAVSEMREIRTRDQSGRIISSFEGGSPSDWMRVWACEPKRLVAIKTR